MGVLLGGLYLQPHHEHLPEILLGAIVILITGALDDRYAIRPVVKLAGQLIASSFLISSGLIIERITIPVFGMVDLGFMSVLITVLWVVGITNAINLIDGLDGLATGVTTIALTSMFVMAIIDAQVVAAYLCIVLIGANLGFLYHNFYPAKFIWGIPVRISWIHDRRRVGCRPVQKYRPVQFHHPGHRSGRANFLIRCSPSRGGLTIRSRS